MDLIMELSFMIHLSNKLLLKIHHMSSTARLGSGVQRWPGPILLARSSLFNERDRPQCHGRWKPRHYGRPRWAPTSDCWCMGGFLENAASKLSLEGYMGIFWRKGRGEREEHCRIFQGEGLACGKENCIYLVFSETFVIKFNHTSQMILKK